MQRWRWLHWVGAGCLGTIVAPGLLYANLPWKLSSDSSSAPTQITPAITVARPVTSRSVVRANVPLRQATAFHSVHQQNGVQQHTTRITEEIQVNQAVSSPAVTPAPVNVRVTEHGICRYLTQPDRQGMYLATPDVTTSVVDGDDLLAPLNRSVVGSVAPDYVPTDLVDVRTMRPATVDRCEPPGGQCLRRDAAVALRQLLSAMHTAGFEGYIHSAFREYTAQCAVFSKWAYREGQGFCHATEQSALAGHSQHQLGTALDLFTEDWVAQGQVFRAGFACTDGARWMAEHAWEYGFVLPYPQHADYRSRTESCWTRTDLVVPVNPHTGYRAEPWHLRFIGIENARLFHSAWVASTPGSATEITLEQWIRQRTHRVGDTDLPVCDGCSCGACTTLASTHMQSSPNSPRETVDTPCAHQSLQLRPDGSVVSSSVHPRLLEARVTRRADDPTLVTVEVLLAIAPGTVTQTPSIGLESQPWNVLTSYLSVAPIRHGAYRRYEDLPEAWRIVMEPVNTENSEQNVATPWPWRTALADPVAAGPWNGANVLLPAAVGQRRFRTFVRPGKTAVSLRLGLSHDQQVTQVVQLILPPAVFTTVRHNEDE